MEKKAIKEAYNTIDVMVQEVITADQQSLEGICRLLEQENSKLQSPVVKDIIRLLGIWDKAPSNEIKTEVDKLLMEMP